MTDRESRLRGVILMVVAVGVFSVMDALMKHLAATYPAMQIADRPVIAVRLERVKSWGDLYVGADEADHAGQA